MIVKAHLFTRGLESIIAGAKATAQRSRIVLNYVGKSLENAFKQNFRELNSTKSRFGHNFYTREGEAKTFYEVAESGTHGFITVRSYAMAHALRGGPVKAKNVKYLTIPVSLEAMKAKGGARDSGIANLRFHPTRRGGLLFTRGSHDGAPKVVHYVLVPQVTHKPRPYVIPPQDVLDSAVRYGIKQANLYK